MTYEKHDTTYLLEGKKAQEDTPLSLLRISLYHNSSLVLRTESRYQAATLSLSSSRRMRKEKERDKSQAAAFLFV